jgi:hypothetical protein
MEVSCSLYERALSMSVGLRYSLWYEYCGIPAREKGVGERFSLFWHMLREANEKCLTIKRRKNN